MQGRRTPVMPPSSTEQFWVMLRASRLFPAQEVDQIESGFVGPAEGPVGVGCQLVQRGVLTSFQLGELLEGRCDGLVLGPYRLLERLGAGGMGRVYKAEHQVMKRPVALKVMGGPSSKGPVEGLSAAYSEREFFLREVQALARLSHPNIVTAYDAGEGDGVCFLVLEYVPGIDLGRLVPNTGPVPVALACECVRQVAVGLHYAHERGVLHGDIKPANLLLREEAFSREGLALAERPVLVKILDLGLARLSGASPSTADEQKTPAGGLMGTPDFMAPELAEHPGRADERSDLYSLGCTFYYLLTGQVPFPGGTWTEKLLHHRFDPVAPVGKLRPDIPLEVCAIVHRLLAKEPGERYPTAGLAALHLQEWLSYQGDWRASLTLAWPPKPTDTPLPEEVLAWPAVAAAPAEGPVPERPHADASASDVFVIQEEVAPSPSRRRKESASRTWREPAALFAAVLLGLTVAGLVSVPRISPPPQSFQPTAPADQAAFRIDGGGPAFATLSEAVQAAHDGDALVIDGSRSVAVRPVEIRGKSLTLKAAPGQRARLTIRRDGEASEWQALLTSDRALTLERIDIQEAAPAGAKGRAVPFHLVACENSSLRLTDCRLLAPAGSALVVCRGSSSVEVEGCTLAAASLALCVQVGVGSPCRVRLSENTIRIGDTGGAALSVWPAQADGRAALMMELKSNRVEAGRVLAISRGSPRVDITAEGNDFFFREALLSFAGLAPGEGWRHATTWRGGNNRYQARGEWLAVDGFPAGVRDLAAWRDLWNDPETGSAECSASESARSIRAAALD